MSDLPDVDGYHREWVVDDGWKVGGDGRVCRHGRCPNLAVAALRRRNRRCRTGWNWWHYCELHLYGRRIKDGAVKVECLVEDVAK
jgi:hypothetical protein